MNSSPGHNVDDDLMYGSGTTKPTIENPGNVEGQGSHPVTEGAATKSPGTTTTSDPAPPAQSQAQDDASTASIKSGVLGSSPGESRLTSQAANKTTGADYSGDPVSHPADADSRDFATRANPQANSGLTRSKDEETAAIGQTSTYSSYPLATGDSTSRVIDRESGDPTTHRQPETMSSPTSRAGVGGGAAQAAAAHAWPEDTQKNTNAPEQGFPAAGRVATGEGSHLGSRDGMSGQHPTADSDNPYASSHLDPRVDPHAKPTSTGGALAAGASVPSANDHASRLGESGSSTEDRGLSGAKTTAESFDGLKGTSEPLHGAIGTAEPWTGPKGTSELRHEEDQYQARTGAMPVASGLETPPAQLRSPDPVPHHQAPHSGVHSLTTAAGPTDSSRAANSPVGTSDTIPPTEDSHHGRNAGILGAAAGALGLGGYAAKKHAENEPERPTVGSRRESIPTTTYPPGTGLDDKRYPQAPVGGFAAAPSGLQDTSAAPSTEAYSQPSTTTGTGAFQPSTGTGPSTTTPAPTAVDDSHLGRNAAIGGAGVVGAGAVGAHEYSSHHATGASTSEPATATGPFTGQSTATPVSTTVDRQEESHLGRNAAVGGTAAAGTGALGVHEHSKHHAPGATATEPITSTGATTGQPTAGPVSTTVDRQEESHLGRNAAIGGAAAAGAGAVGAHEYSKHQAEHEAQQRLEADRAHQEAMEESRKAAEKEQKVHEKALHKEEKKAEKEHEKAVHKEEKKVEKEHEKLIKEEERKQKEHEKLIAKQEKEVEKGGDSEDHKEKKKGGFLGLFKRRRDSKGNEVEHEEDDHAGAKTAAGVGAAGAAGVGIHEAEKHHEAEKKPHGHLLHHDHHEINKLHKDPPPGLGYSGDSATPAHADYAVRENDHPGAQTATGGYTAPAPEHDRHKYGGAAGVGAAGAGAAGAGAAGTAAMTDRTRGTAAMTDRTRGTSESVTSPSRYAEAPTKGYASHVTGGTGTTALAQGDPGYTPGNVAYQAMGGTNPTAAADANRSMPAGDYVHPTPGSTETAAPPGGYASHVTGGTGTTALAHGDRGSNAGDVAWEATGGSPTSAATQGDRGITGARGHGVSGGGHDPGASSGAVYGDAPTKGYASQVTGGTGTTALAQDRARDGQR